MEVSGLTVFDPIRSEVNALEVIWMVVTPMPSMTVPRRTVDWIETPNMPCRAVTDQKRNDARRTAPRPTSRVIFRPRYWFTVRIGNEVRKPVT